MANRICKCQKLYQYLIMSQKIREAKRYVKGNYEFLETLSIINEAKNIEDVNVKRDYVRFAKAFICKKYPNTNEKYLE